VLFRSCFYNRPYRGGFPSDKTYYGYRGVQAAQRHYPDNSQRFKKQQRGYDDCGRFFPAKRRFAHAYEHCFSADDNGGYGAAVQEKNVIYSLLSVKGVF
jgi:hypothetical protein